MDPSKEQLEVYISCRSLKNMDILTPSDPQVVMYMRNDENDVWTQIGKTEIVWNNLNPNFVKTILVDYFFEKQQYVKLDVRDCDSETKFNFIGSVETSIAAIVGSKNSTKILDIANNKKENTGKIILRAEKNGGSCDYVSIKFHGMNFPNYKWFKWLGRKPNPFLKLYKIIEGQPPLLVYQSETVKSTTHPDFKLLEVNAAKFCNDDLNNQILVEAWDYRKNIGNHTFLGQVRFTVSSALNKFENSMEKLEYELNDPKHKSSKGILVLDSIKIGYKPQFLDYIKTGTQLQLVLAIDFTSSNGEPQNSTSLHYMKGNQPNQYHKAISAVGDILINYDSDKLVPVYGFGGTKGFKDVSHCFALNENEENPEVYGVHGIIQIYQQALQTFKLSGPTHFGSIISKAMEECQEIKNKGLNSYMILLILTDGVIHDMDIAKKLIVDSARLPLSIIIVGIGSANFSDMEVLDGDDGLWDNNGRKAERDLVQFVPFNEFNGNPIKLAECVLEELPTQLVEYMHLVHQLPPRSDEPINLANIMTDFEMEDENAKPIYTSSQDQNSAASNSRSNTNLDSNRNPNLGLLK